MSFPIKFLSLQKAELEYEVGIRGTTPGTTVQELRKQICKVGPLFPSEDIMDSHLSVSEDLTGVNEVLVKIGSNMLSNPDRNLILRTQNLLHHVYHRLNRIVCDDITSPLYDECVTRFKEYLVNVESLKDCSVDNLAISSKTDASQISSPLNITVHCDRGTSAEISKLKYDGKTCVRAFIQRVTEFREARNISSPSILSLATEIFSGDALHWFRSIKEQVTDFENLVELLKRDFDRPDYDYRLLSEIRSRTQGETENITVYLSIMAGLFSRLSRSPSEDDKLEIILHNVRPAYANILASSPGIKTIADLRSVCRNFEDVQARLAYFHEPPKVTTDTLAPEFAYNGNNKARLDMRQQNNNSTSFNNNNYFLKNKKPYSIDNTHKYEGYVHAVDVVDAKPRFCPRCRVDTHHLRQCPADKSVIFCFICGRKGVKAPDCPDCADNKQSGSKN